MRDTRTAQHHGSLLEPPPQLQAWLAAYSGPVHNTFYRGGARIIGPLGQGNPLPDTPPNAYLATFGVNKLVISIFGHRLPPATMPRRVIGFHPPLGGIDQLWPMAADPLIWPPVVQITTETALRDFWLGFPP